MPPSKPLAEPSPTNYAHFIRETFVGLTVAVVILNLGAAMGLLSGRGAYIGMVSAGLIAFVTGLLSGTKVQNSSPTAPMAALMATIMAYAYAKFPNVNNGLNPEQFVNIVLLMAGAILIIGSVLGLGRYVRLVPNIVISGFMSGIAVLIWTLEFSKFNKWLNADLAQGSYDIALVVLTVLLSFQLPKLMQRLCGQGHLKEWATLIPGTLLSLIVITIGVQLLNIPASFLESPPDQESVFSVSWIASQFPKDLSIGNLLTALPYAFELALLCALDTLITALIIARMTQHNAVRHRRDLGAQGVAGILTGFIGGVPGAQSTAPSVLLLKEKASTRWATISTGLFALMIAIAIAPWLQYLPTAVFSGILIKVGYNVFDQKPFKEYWCNRQQHCGFLLLVGTLLCTAFINIIVAVCVFTILYHCMNKTCFKNNPVKDFV